MKSHRGNKLCPGLRFCLLSGHLLICGGMTGLNDCFIDLCTGSDENELKKKLAAYHVLS